MIRIRQTITSIVLLCLVIFSAFKVNAQTTNLQQGDVSIIGWGSNSGSFDDRSIGLLTWVPLNTGTVIKFTTNTFKSNTASSTSSGNANASGGQMMSFTVTSSISAGSVIKIVGFLSSAGSTPTITCTTGSGIVALAAINAGGNGVSFSTSTTGRAIFIYQGSDWDATSSIATFSGNLLCGLIYQGNSGSQNWLVSGSANTSRSYKPADLPITGFFGNLALDGFAANARCGYYSGTTSGFATIDAAKAAVNNTSNWIAATTSTSIASPSFISGFTIPVPNNAPTFTSLVSTLSVCKNSIATSINSLLTVSDVDFSQTETWSILSAPAHGTLSGFSTSAAISLFTSTPSGLTYTPTSGYSGTDFFTILVSDGNGGLASKMVTVTIKATSTSSTLVNICSNSLPYTWNGLTFNAAGSQTAHLTNSIGCDSLATLSLTIKASSTSTNNVSICQSVLPYTWNGIVYSVAGTYTQILTNSVGCGSVATLNLTVNTAPNISYNGLNSIYNVGTSINTVPPTNTGGQPTPSSSIVTSIVTIGQGSSFSSPTGIAIDANGVVYVADLGNGVIKKIAVDGTVTSIGSGFSNPTGVAVDAAGIIYVADRYNNAVKKIATDGTITTIGYGFNQPTGVAVDANSVVYVADFNNNAVKKITTDGTVTSIGSGFYYPSGVALDANGVLYVGDYYNMVVKKITTKGTMTTVTPPYFQTWAVAVDASGAIYIADYGNHAVRKIDINGTISTLGSGFYLTGGVAVDKSGAVYVTDQGNNAVKKMVFATYDISPALPAGLNFNTTTGAISGTPAIVTPNSVYTITTQNDCGSSTATVNFATSCSTLPSTTNISICSSELPYSWNGVRAAAGTYTFTTTNSKGCDSLATLNLFINNTTSNTTANIALAALPYTWNGVSYTGSGTYTKTFFGGNSKGCDSIATLNLLVAPKITVNSQWTWLNGDSIVSGLSVYGTKGIAAASNKPGARGGSLSWTDDNGNFWLFGGGATNGTLNDLWKYNITTNQWTWVSGDNGFNQSGYNGVPSYMQYNHPGSRSGGVSWKDANGNLWLFGGLRGGSSGSAAYLNDLWKYNINTDQWTRISDGVSGSQPNGRTESIGWADNSDNLWLYGGSEYTSFQTSILSQLWKYNIATSKWTLISISNNTNQGSVYGTKGTAAASNHPGARCKSLSWVDSNGDLWLFGGQANASKSYGSLNDLWKYNTTSGQWTWVSGDNTINNVGIYGSKGTAVASNKPGARVISSTWTDANGNLWLFGGNGYASGGIGLLNDLWKYNIINDEWIWMSGDTTTSSLSIYGSKGITAVGNTPGARNSSASWIDANGSLWLFGGGGYAASAQNGSLNDLWKLEYGCNGSTSTTAHTACGSYLWNGVTYNASGVYTKTGLTNAAGCDSIATLNLTINQFTSSTTDSSICSTDLPFNWNGITVSSAGMFYLNLTNAAGCDSLTIINLTVKEPTSSFTNQQICFDALPYNWNGNIVYNWGLTELHYTNAAGCDSTATLFLTELPHYFITRNAGSNGTIQVNTPLIVCINSNSAIYSIVPNPGYVISDVLIDGISYGAISHYQFFNVTANHTISASFVLACSPTTSTTTVSNCGSYLWNNTNYTSSGSYTVNFTNTCGSDSAAILNLTINNVTTSTNNLSICSGILPYTWNGLTFNTSGSQTATLTNALGCDSLATLNLSVSNTTTSLTTIVNCDSYTWNGTTYTTSGTYNKQFTGVGGCDSIAILNLTVVSSLPSIIGAKGACAGSTTTLSNAVAGGVWFTQATSQATIHPSTGLVTAKNAGTITFQYSKAGCGSVTKAFIVNPIPAVPTITYAPGTPNPQAGAPTGGFCVGKTFSIVGTPNTPAGVWSSTGVVGITSGGVVTINSVGAGSIKYIYTNAAGCSNSRTMSGNGFSCASRGVNTIDGQLSTVNGFTMYPNPAKGFINLNVETVIGAGSIVVTDLYGKTVKTQNLSMGTNTLNIAKLSKGFYLVSIITSEGKTTKKLVVE